MGITTAVISSFDGQVAVFVGKEYKPDVVTEIPDLCGLFFNARAFLHTKAKYSKLHHR